MRHPSGVHDEERDGDPSAGLSVVAVRWLAQLHAVGFNAALVAGLALMPPVIAVGYWTGHARGDVVGARIASHDLRGTFDGADASPGAVRSRSPRGGAPRS